MTEMRKAECGVGKRGSIMLVGILLAAGIVWSGPAYAEIKIIEADSTYILGDNDSRIDARRIAVQEAKRKALELAGVYVESLTVVKNYQLTSDEVKSYAAGVLETEVVSEQMGGTTERPEISIRARCRIDTDVIAAQIDRLRNSEDLKEQLETAAQENAALKKERDALVRQLAAEKDKAKAEVARTKLGAVLAKEEAHDDTMRVWASLAPAFEEGNGAAREIKPADLDQSAVVLERVARTDPRNLRARQLLAAVYQRRGDLAAAERELRGVIQLHPSHPAPHLALGLLLRSRGNYQEALREFHFVERLRPRHLPVVFHAAVTFGELGKCGKAVQYFNRFLRDPRSARYPRMREQALVSVEKCGGDRPGRPRRVRQP